jgi:phosphoesterase RecJ-like protein
MTTPLLAIGGVRIAVLFREMDGGRVKVSLRSKGALDVHGLAAEFGGGGHRNASGIVMSGDLDEVADTVTARAEALAQRT